MTDSFARELDIDDFWDRHLLYVLGLGLGYIEPDFWRDVNPVNMVVIAVWHWRETWRLIRRQYNETST